MLNMCCSSVILVVEIFNPILGGLFGSRFEVGGMVWVQNYTPALTFDRDVLQKLTLHKSSPT